MRFVVIGCGRWGAALVRDLLSEGKEVTLVDRDPNAFERIGNLNIQARLVGSCLEESVMAKADLATADGVAALTGSDEVNITVVRLARQVYRVPRAVARLYDPKKSDIYQRLGLQTVSPVVWGANRMKELLVFSSLGVTATLGGGSVELLEIEVPASFVGRPVETIDVAGEAHLVALTRRGSALLPLPGLVFEKGDRAHLAVMTTTVGRLREWLGVS